MAIARYIPNRDQWNTARFDEKKAIVKKHYGLSNGQFSAALDLIQNTREMAARIGIESSEAYLRDDDAVFVIEQWRRLHPPREGDPEVGLDYFNADRFERWAEEAAVESEIIAAIDERLSPYALADLEARFYLARDGIFSEYYERFILRKCREHAVVKDRPGEIQHLIEKTNLLQCLTVAAKRLGRLKLAARLEDF
jgi:hypothetical protein